MSQYPTRQEAADLRAVRDVVGSGHFPSSHLYKIYCGVVTQGGRSPVNRIRFGQVLAEYGAIRKPKWDKNKPREGKKPGYMVSGWIL